MNFLGHLYFSRDDHQLMYANLYGDFFKGNHLDPFPEIVQQGIRLHRSIDHYIDHHPEVRELMRSLYSELPKIAGIAIDLYFDHLLARNWEEYHSDDLNDFTQRFYASENQHESYFSADFLFMLEKMREKNWLWQYQYSYGLMKACNGVSRRLSFPNKLENAHVVFEQYEPRITETFHRYMSDARVFFAERTL